MQSISIMGSTGSIGGSTLDVLRLHPERYRVFALCAHRQIEKLYAQCIEFEPKFAVLGQADLAKVLQEKLEAAGSKTRVLHGRQALVDMACATEVDVVMAAIVGGAGLESIIAAAQSGKKILLANKEALVMGGALFIAAVQAGGATLLPVDSEHNAIFQSMPAGYMTAQNQENLSKEVRRLILTASGGPFRQKSLHELRQVSPEDACAHPNWVMGKKISVDSATMMNKGLEVIEAYWLFNMPTDRIEVVIHPQSVIHSLVEYVDGSVLAQLGNPDMRAPIAHALAYPERIESGVSSLDLCQIARFDFESPDYERFPCLKLAYDALDAGGSALVVLNAANEIAVEAFLQRQLAFLDIAQICDNCLQNFPHQNLDSLDAVIEADEKVRDLAKRLIAEH